jgi:hypothetical protein
LGRFWILGQIWKKKLYKFWEDFGFWEKFGLKMNFPHKRRIIIHLGYAV